MDTWHTRRADRLARIAPTSMSSVSRPDPPGVGPGLLYDIPLMGLIIFRYHAGSMPAHQSSLVSMVYSVGIGLGVGYSVPGNVRDKVVGFLSLCWVDSAAKSEVNF